MAVAIHISKNEDTERASNTVDNDSGTGIPPKFVTYELTGYGFTVGNGAVERYESRYMRDTTRLTQATEKDIV